MGGLEYILIITLHTFSAMVSGRNLSVLGENRL